MVHGGRSVLVLLAALGIVYGHQEFESTLSKDVLAAVQTRTGVTVPDMYLPTLVGPDTPCGEALAAMNHSLYDPTTVWALAMVDSWGKSRDGILYYGWMFAGSYDECVDTRTPDNSFSGQYCHITLIPTNNSDSEGSPEMPNVERGPDGPYHIVPGFQPWQPFGLTPMSHAMGPELLRYDMDFQQHIPQSNSHNSHNHQFSRRSQQSHERQFQKPDEQSVPVFVNIAKPFTNYATCMPSVCTKEQLQTSLDKTLSKAGLYGWVWDCQVGPDQDFLPNDIAFISVVSCFLLLLLVASVVDIYIQKSGNTELSKGPVKFLLPFSAYTNLQKMFHLSTNPSPSTITCLHGMRVLSMTWVMWCHQQAQANFAAGQNPETAMERLSGFWAQIIINGYPNVDTFFFLSGLLLSYSVLGSLKRTGKFNIIIFYVHRIIRLLPPMALVIWMNATVVRFFLAGPYSFLGHRLVDSCRDYWWKDLVFADNFLIKEGVCLSQTWYVSVDAQLYLIAPLLLLPLYWYKQVGRAILYVATLVSVIVPAAIIYALDLPPEAVMVSENGDDYFDKVYLTPWCRAGPWVVGIWLGYIFHLQGNKKIKMSPLLVIVGWTVATLTGLLVVFGIWSYNTFDPMPYEVMTQVVYGGLHRSAWGAALAWVVYACHNGYGGMVNGFLSHPNWQPLSRLTYTIYLVVLNLQMTMGSNLRYPAYFTHINKIIETVGALAAALPIAILVSLIAEAPILGLEKLLLVPGSQKTRKPETNPEELPIVSDNLPATPLDNMSPDKEYNTTTATVNLGFISKDDEHDHKLPPNGDTKF